MNGQGLNTLIMESCGVSFLSRSVLGRVHLCVAPCGQHIGLGIAALIFEGVIAMTPKAWQKAFIKNSDNETGFEVFLVRRMADTWAAVAGGGRLHMLNGGFRGRPHSLQARKGIRYDMIDELDRAERADAYGRALDALAELAQSKGAAATQPLDESQAHDYNAPRAEIPADLQMYDNDAPTLEMEDKQSIAEQDLFDEIERELSAGQEAPDGDGASSGYGLDDLPDVCQSPIIEHISARKDGEQQHSPCEDRVVDLTSSAPVEVNEDRARNVICETD